VLCDCVGFPPIPVESAAAKPAPTVTQSSAAAASTVPAAPPKVSPKPQLQKQSKELSFVTVLSMHV